MQAQQPRINRSEGAYALVLVPTRELAVQVRPTGAPLARPTACSFLLAHMLCTRAQHMQGRCQLPHPPPPPLLSLLVSAGE